MSRDASVDYGPFVPFRKATALPVGSCLSTRHIQEKAFIDPFIENFSQLTPEWEMKMNAILLRDGRYNLLPGDTLVNFARKNAMRVHATTLVWYKHEPERFKMVDGDKRAFARLYRDYITTVAGHFAGKVVGWDVVNEPLAHLGEGYRDSLWSRNLGADDYMVRAFELAKAADPRAVLFINEYSLEKIPAKRVLFMQLIERLLKRGVAIGGIGSQTHVSIDVPPGASRAAIRDLASFGLPIHISELDVSMGYKPVDLRSDTERLTLQADRATEVVDAFLDLPEKQRYALTIWGLRDRDSWLRLPPFEPDKDRPLAFDDAGQPKPMARAISARLAKAKG